MQKTDLRRQLRHLYGPSARAIAEVQVPQLRFLMVDGHGDPNDSAAYAEAVQALFTVSYATKFAMKRSGQCDYSVMPLEGLWWAEDLEAFRNGERSQWQWTLMIMQPDLVPEPVLHEAIAGARKKDLPGLARLRIGHFEEGRCAQVLHVGPFAEEGPTIDRLHAWITARTALRGKHHEIYLSDIRRAAPARWKTIIRQPMQ